MRNIGRNNPRSHFWRFFRHFDATLETVAWTNLCKMDPTDGSKPPNMNEFLQVKEACMVAFAEELGSLAPHVTVIATSYYRKHVFELLAVLGQGNGWQTFNGKTVWSRSPEGQFVIVTRHPQGWRTDEMQEVVGLVNTMLRSREMPAL